MVFESACEEAASEMWQAVQAAVVGGDGLMKARGLVTAMREAGSGNSWESLLWHLSQWFSVPGNSALLRSVALPQRVVSIVRLVFGATYSAVTVWKQSSVGISGIRCGLPEQLDPLVTPVTVCLIHRH
ncbi:MAG: hypothetical protein ABSG25_13805 [Bryobacteraceae bacterium]